MHNKTIAQCFALLVLLMAATALIAAFGWDLRLAGSFYVPGFGFPTGNLQPWRALYRYGEWPAFLMGAAGLLVLLASYIDRRLIQLRRSALFLSLLLVIGPGLLVNAGFKDHWGRPRPRQVDQLGGTMPFHQTWQPGPAPKNASFPAGHPTAAFYMSAPYFVLRRSRPRQAQLWLWGGFGYGLLMGAARIIQGGHFLSDVVWSAGFVYLTALVLADLLKPDMVQGDKRTNCATLPDGESMQ